VGAAMRLQARFTYLPASPGRVVELRVISREPTVMETIALKDGWNEYSSKPFAIPQPEFTLSFLCRQPPVKIEPGERRLMAFLIKNPELSVVESVRLDSVTGGYGDEIDGPNVLRWTGDQLQYKFHLDSSGPMRLRAKFGYLPASSGRDVAISVQNSILETIHLKDGWNSHVSKPFEVRWSEFTLTFTSRQPPIRPWANDQRIVAFLIKNLELEFVN
jgi:hypothetical protein